MYPTLLHIHSVLRWFVLIFLVLNIINASRSMRGTNPLSAGDRQMSLYGLIFTHVQFLLGLGLYFYSPKVQFSQVTMETPVFRFFTVEHALTMLIAVVLITLANRHAKTGNAKKMFWFLVIALVLILVSIPWPFRLQLGGGWY